MTKSNPRNLGHNCRICDEILSIENTTPSRRNGPPSTRICRECYNEDQRARRRTGKGIHYKEKTIKTTEKNYLGSNCRICNEVLSIENTTPSMRKGPPSNRICRSCVNQRAMMRKLEKQKQLENSKPELKPEAMRLLRENGSSIQTAKIMGVKKEIIVAWIRQEGLNPLDYTIYAHRNNEDRNIVLDLLREGKAQREIHRLTGVSTSSIYLWKKELEREGFL